MSTIAVLLAGIAGGMVLSTLGFAWLQRRRRSAELESVPGDIHHVIDLMRRAHGADAVCVTAHDGEPLWAKSAPEPPPRLTERTLMLASLALAERREHVVAEDSVVVAFGDGRLGGAVLFGKAVDLDAVRAASGDIRRLLAECAVGRTSGGVEAPMLESTPEWLTPDTVEGIGAALCEAARRISGRPTAVVTRDPLTNEAAVTAVSAGTDRRLMRMHIAPTSVVGRACMGQIAAVGQGGGLFGTRRYNRRRREERARVYSLYDGTLGVGALIIFDENDAVDEQVNRRVEALTKGAGPIVGRTLDLYAATHRAMTDELTGQPNKHALAQAMVDHANGPCSLLSVNVDQLDQMEPPAATAALQHVARIFRKSLRDYDVPARVGAEGFALFLPDTPFHHAFEVADRIRIAVSEEVFDWAGGEHLLTCSFGVASVPEVSRSPEDLLEAAQLALQEACREGRNCISAAQPLLN
jgi:diguanylate cyclase (GGDEF)-like protein